VSEKDKLVVAWTITGTHRGELLGNPATNKKISVSGITIKQIADGKILESTVVRDVGALMQQLGLEVPLKLDVLAATAASLPQPEEPVLPAIACFESAWQRFCCRKPQAPAT